MSFKNSDGMTSISTRGGVHFWEYLLHHQQFGHETWKYF